MYTIADVKNISVDIVGTISAWLLNNIDVIAWTCMVLIIFYCGMWVERRRKKMEDE